MKCRGEEGVLRGEVLNVWGGEGGSVERGGAECVRRGGRGG